VEVGKGYAVHSRPPKRGESGWLVTIVRKRPEKGFVNQEKN